MKIYLRQETWSGDVQGKALSFYFLLGVCRGRIARRGERLPERERDSNQLQLYAILTCKINLVFCPVD